MFQQPITHTIKRFATLRTHRIAALPIVILMPHSACNCRCVMCDIWKGNKNLQQLSIEDVQSLLKSLRSLGTKQVVLSGGEALLHDKFFALCALLKKAKLHITLLSTGLGLKHHADQLLQSVDDIIVSLDGDEATHNRIRNNSAAYEKLREGVRFLKQKDPSYRISARCVIHRMNFRQWPQIVQCAKAMGLDSISFLPADVSSNAFNRTVLWKEDRQAEVALDREELPELKRTYYDLLDQCRQEFDCGFILESPEKLGKIYSYYSALHGLSPMPFKKCNAPWVSAVIEPDGSVRPCFFHEAYGNIRRNSLDEILNGKKALAFRKDLDMDTNETCRRCVCYLNLPPSVNPAMIK